MTSWAPEVKGSASRNAVAKNIFKEVFISLKKGCCYVVVIFLGDGYTLWAFGAYIGKEETARLLAD